MIVKSRQDTYQYTHDQKQAGFSADVGFDGKPQSFSINGGKTDVDDPNTLTQDEKDKLINQAKLIAGITAAFAGEDVNVAAGVAAEAVENNTFAEMYPNEWDEIVNNTDGSYSLELHEAISRNKQYILIGTSFIPVVGDIQGFVEAKTAGDHVFATIGLIPGLGDVAQKAHKAKKAYDTAKSANDVKGMKSAIQEGVDVLKAEGRAEVVSGRSVASRINIANGRTAYTPLRSNGHPVSAGFDHVLEGHFNSPLANNRSVFSITPDELKRILSDKHTISSPVRQLDGGQFERVVNTGRIVGKASLNQGGR